MLTNSDSQYPVEFWLKWIKEETRFQPQTIMIDNSNIEMAEIRSAYGESVQVLIWHWHIKRAWCKNLAKKVCVCPGVSTNSHEVKLIRDGVFNS